MARNVQDEQHQAVNFGSSMVTQFTQTTRLLILLASPGYKFCHRAHMRGKLNKMQTLKLMSLGTLSKLRCRGGQGSFTRSSPATKYKSLISLRDEYGG